MSNDNLTQILADYKQILDQNEKVNQEITKINEKVDKRIKICDDTDKILDSATTEFKVLTSIINKKDIPFFVFSILLQCGIKYYIKVLREMSDKELAKK